MWISTIKIQLQPQAQPCPFGTCIVAALPLCHLHPAWPRGALFARQFSESKVALCARKQAAHAFAARTNFCSSPRTARHRCPRLPSTAQPSLVVACRNNNSPLPCRTKAAEAALLLPVAASTWGGCLKESQLLLFQSSRREPSNHTTTTTPHHPACLSTITRPMQNAALF